MSLDVHLTIEGAKFPQPSGIFVREDGETKQISESEWYTKNPDREPVMFQGEETDEVYSANITHNLGTMADKAGIYYALWRPEEIGFKIAKDLIHKLEIGLDTLKSNPDYFKEFNPENGWGKYEGLVNFVEQYLKACKEYPEAIIGVSR